ncbi:MAG: outer membrane lipoprotein carrier protein LolA [Fibrobacterota bacterium]
MIQATPLFFLTICYILLTQASAITPDELLLRTEKGFLDSKTITADFTLTIQWQLRDTTEKKKGRIYLNRPKKYRIELEDALFITDGSTFWRYSARNKQVVINDVSEMQDGFQPGEWFLKYTDKFKPVGLDSGQIAKARCYIVSLVPKEGDRFRNVTVWINAKSSLPAKFETTDKNDNVAEYLITAITKDKPLADSLFSFRAPKGTEVINMRE